MVWNRTRKVRDPRTGRRVQRERPKSEWVTLQAPHLQIVSAELWGAVERRLAMVKASFAAGTSPGLCCRSLSAQYLLSGFLKCGVCGAKMVVVSGRGQSGRARYGCPMKHARGICTNHLHLRQDTIEREVIGGLQSRVLREDVAAYALAEFKRQLKAKLEGARSQLGTLRQEREKLKGEISNLAAVIAQGRQSPALLSELEKRERRVAEISDEIFSSTSNSLDAKLQDIERFVMRRLSDIHGLLTETCCERSQSWQSTAQKSLSPRKDKPTKSAAIGTCWADVRMVPGARIELATPAFSGQRSTNELPRQPLALQF